MRGVAEAKLGELQTRLASLGLIDADPATERVRNIVASPLSDVDPEAILDVAPIVAALEARLAIDENLRALPGKFEFVVDAGGRWPLGDVEADVRFEAFAATEGCGSRCGSTESPTPNPSPQERGGESAAPAPLPSPPLAGRGRGWGGPRCARSSPPATSPKSPGA